MTDGAVWRAMWLFLMALALIAGAIVYFWPQPSGSVAGCVAATVRSLDAGVILTDYGPECHGLTAAEQERVAAQVAAEL